MPNPAPLSAMTAATMLRGAAEAIAAEVRVLPAEIARWHPAPGEWCVNDVLGHLIEAERRGFAGRIRIILDAPTPALEGWDPAEVSRSRRDCEKPSDALLAEFLAMREDGARLVAGLTADGLAHIGRHPKVGDLSVRDVLQEWIYHDRNHLKQIVSNVQAWAWPHMGNTQKFTTM